MRFAASSLLSVKFSIHIHPSFYFPLYPPHYPNYAILIRVAVLCIMNMLSDNNAGPQPMAQLFFVIQTKPEDILIWQIYLASRRRLISSGDEFALRLPLSGGAPH